MLSRLDLRDREPGAPLSLPRPQAATDPPTDAVKAIIAEVRARGDDALRELSEKFDHLESPLGELRVPASDVEAAVDGLAPLLREALETARANILAYHREQLRPDVRVERDGVVLRELRRPVE